MMVNKFQVKLEVANKQRIGLFREICVIVELN
jgi:hypothetical protein